MWNDKVNNRPDPVIFEKKFKSWTSSSEECAVHIQFTFYKIDCTNLFQYSKILRAKINSQHKMKEITEIPSASSSFLIKNFVGGNITWKLRN